jgi:catechol 2,3-dioxygenase-like lactoylglutathione lyase family enzyme
MNATHAIKGLGEIALQVEDLDEMQAFYRDAVGLELLRRFPTSAFFRIADGVAGHTQVLALFDRRGDPEYRPVQPGSRTPPLDHIAFGIDLADFEAERARLEGLGQDVRVATHAWVGWRSLYVNDPEGNVVEWVCFDPAVLTEG